MLVGAGCGNDGEMPARQHCHVLLYPNYQDEMGNRYNIRIEGTRVRHSMGMASIKMYDKFGQILRIETTAKDISFQTLPGGRTTQR